MARYNYIKILSMVIVLCACMLLSYCAYAGYEDVTIRKDGIADPQGFTPEQIGDRNGKVEKLVSDRNNIHERAIRDIIANIRYNEDGHVEFVDYPEGGQASYEYYYNEAGKLTALTVNYSGQDLSVSIDLTELEGAMASYGQLEDSARTSTTTGLISGQDNMLTTGGHDYYELKITSGKPSDGPSQAKEEKFIVMAQAQKNFLEDVATNPVKEELFVKLNSALDELQNKEAVVNELKSGFSSIKNVIAENAENLEKLGVNMRPYLEGEKQFQDKETQDAVVYDTLQEVYDKTTTENKEYYITYLREKYEQIKSAIREYNTSLNKLYSIISQISKKGGVFRVKIKNAIQFLFNLGGEEEQESK